MECRIKTIYLSIEGVQEKVEIIKPNLVQQFSPLTRKTSLCLSSMKINSHLPFGTIKMTDRKKIQEQTLFFSFHVLHKKILIIRFVLAFNFIYPKSLLETLQPD